MRLKGAGTALRYTGAPRACSRRLVTFVSTFPSCLYKVLIQLPLFASQASRSNLYLKAYMPVAGDDGTCGNG
eukprot:1158376-Prymnesium_polylepis.1